ncbi:hypothetical protein NESM_000339600 [Novymonas esmeraldas]|uniref:Nitroreductase domain-containing protein n=1 Tax=Novymonas esmeraldas TaxID=1808958 RepID=A0AAW0EJC6_9TRYP
MPSLPAESAVDYVDALAAVKLARQLTSVLPQHVTRDYLTTVVQRAVALTPSSFNSQSTRVVVLHGRMHRLFWQRLIGHTVHLAKEAALLTDQVVPAACTVILCEDMDVVRRMQATFPKYASLLPGHAEQASAMCELSVVSALGCDGVATLSRHHRIDLHENFHEVFTVPPSWEMRAQIACGGCGNAGYEKETLSDDHYFKIIRN